MDILNWVYLLKNKLIRTDVQDAEQDLVILGNNVSYVKRGDKYQSYGMTVQNFANYISTILPEPPAPTPFDFEGTDYIVVLATGTPSQNAAEFITAYGIASAATRSNVERYTIVLSPGVYRFSSVFTHNSSNINIVSLTGQQDVIFDRAFVGSDPFSATKFAYMYDLTIQANATYSNTLQEGQPSFLSVNNASPVEYGFNATGMYFSGDNPGTNGYPIYTSFTIPQSQTTVVTFKFIHSYDCDDQGICVFLDGGSPTWNWGPNASRIAAQYNCTTPTIYGTTLSSQSGSLIIGQTYIAEFTYNPTAGTSTLVTKTLAGVTVSTTSINQVLGAGNYRVGFSADSDDSPALITSPVMDITASGTTVSGIKTASYNSPNFDAWSVFGSTYYLPINVTANQNSITVQNCTAGPFSFGANVTNTPITISSTFINCKSLGGYSFGWSNTNNYGSYTSCISDGEQSFKSITLNGASFNNCTSGSNSFTADASVITSCLFTSCTSGVNSFKAATNIASSTFEYCKGNSGSFLAGATNSGVYFYSRLYGSAFTGGTRYYCQDSL